VQPSPLSPFRTPLRSLSHFLPLPRSLQGLDSLRRVFPSSARENFPVESLRRHGDGIESLSFCCSGGGGIPKHEHADVFELGERKREIKERRKERTRTRPRSAALARSFVIPRAKSTGIPRYHGCPMLHCSHLHRCIPLSVRPPRPQIAIVIANQWKQTQKIRSSHAIVFVRINASLEFLRVTAIIRQEKSLAKDS